MIDAKPAPQDVVVDSSDHAGPRSALDTDSLGIASGSPPRDSRQENYRPFTVIDPAATPDQVARFAATAAGRGRIFVVGARHGPYGRWVRDALHDLQPRFRLVHRTLYRGIHPVELLVLKRG